ncbi:MAG TPA: hypothetical protein VMD91_09415 [Candidatus Sulfotelmatobacter sp.]|nr:hypothetical protein [Candidatus Sulfotelmatobacter sp.]
MSLPSTPQRYDQWVALFEAFKTPEHDEEVRRASLEGIYPTVSGVVQRTTDRLLEAVRHRLKIIHDGLSAELRGGATAVDVERALAGVRTKLLPIARLAICQTFPAAVREHLRDTLNAFTKDLHESIERNARQQSGIDGILLSAVKRVQLEVPWAEALTRAERVPLPDGPVRRRILL